jgi:hypothetical protein
MSLKEATARFVDLACLVAERKLIIILGLFFFLIILDEIVCT